MADRQRSRTQVPMQATEKTASGKVDLRSLNNQLSSAEMGIITLIQNIISAHQILVNIVYLPPKRTIMTRKISPTGNSSGAITEDT